MNSALSDSQKIASYSNRLAGVFTTQDIRSLLNERNPVLLHRRLDALQTGGVLRRFCRGVYVVDGFTPEALAARVIEESYLSLGTVLASELMIGSVPSATVHAVRVGHSRLFEGAGMSVDYAGVTRELFFGYRFVDGIRRATPEKALLDTLYLHMWGRAYSFDIFTDIDVTRVDRSVIDNYLTRYRNVRFRAFVKGFLDDRR